MKGAPAMKKLIAAAAALTTAVNAAALSTNAMFENVPAGRIWDEEIEMFPMMENGNLITDINGDGSFDLDDCALFYGYTHSYDTDEELAKRIESIGDYDANGKADNLDAEHLTRYYLLKNGISASDTENETYSDIDLVQEFKSEYYNWTSRLSDVFIQELKNQSLYLMAGYNMFKETVENGTVSCDVNSDGVYDYTDLDYLWIFGYNSYFFMYESVPDDEKPVIPDEINKHCQELIGHFADGPDTNWFYEYAEMYCIEQNGISDEQFSEDYYDSLIEGSGKLSLARCLKYNYSEWMPCNEYLDNNGALFNREFTSFWEQLSAGEVELPDTNDDGIINSSDVFNAMIFKEDLQNRAAEQDSVLPENVWRFFTENCDINGNGLSGDVRDLAILDLGYMLYIPEAEIGNIYDNFNENLNAYIDQLSAVSGISAVKYSPMSIAAPEFSDIDIERSGDANGDGNVDLSDAVKIMQALANPNKYQISYAGRCNGDVYNTGDCITLGDAQEIQSRLLNS